MPNVFKNIVSFFRNNYAQIESRDSRNISDCKEQKVSKKDKKRKACVNFSIYDLTDAIKSIADFYYKGVYYINSTKKLYTLLENVYVFNICSIILKTNTVDYFSVSNVKELKSKRK